MSWCNGSFIILVLLFQIAQCGAIPILVKMLQSAQDDEEKFNACNTLWTLAFDEENRTQMKRDKDAIPELKKLLMSENIEIKKAAAGALWECEGKEKHAEEKQQSTGAHVQGMKIFCFLLPLYPTLSNLTPARKLSMTGLPKHLAELNADDAVLSMTGCYPQANV